MVHLASGGGVPLAQELQPRPEEIEERDERDSPPAHEQLETAEHAAHVASEGGLRAAIAPLSIAVMAVVAGLLGGLERTASSNAIIARSDASIRRNEASDLWSQFQAESLKRRLYGIAAQQPGANSTVFKSQADGFAADEVTLRAQAEAKETADEIVISENAMERHHQLTYATGIVQLAIAVASISIVIRRRWLWYGSLACLAIGIVMAAV
jgi:hypothetical protein